MRKLSIAGLVLFILSFAGIAAASTCTEYFPSSAATSSVNGGTLDWAFISRITSDDGSYAFASSSAISPISYQVQATNFNIALPSGATIDGIQANIERKGSGSNRYNTNSIQLWKAGAVAGTAKGPGSPWSTSDTVETWGNSTDLWGTTWSESDVEASNFGVVFDIQKDAIESSTIAQVDYVSITLCYTTGDTPTPTITNTPTSTATPTNTNTNTPTRTFTAQPGVDPWLDPAFLCRKKLVFGATSGTSTNAADIPLSVILTSSDIDFTKTKNDGADIRIVRSGSAPAVLPYYISKWDETEAGTVHFKADSISPSGTEYVWIYYNNTGASDAGNPNGIFDDSTSGAFLMNESPVDNSTVTDRNGNNNGVARNTTSGDLVDLSTTAAINRFAINLDKSSNTGDWIDLGNGAAYTYEGDFTIEAMFRVDSDSTYRTLVCKRGENSLYTNYCLRISDTGYPQFFIITTSNVYLLTSSVLATTTASEVDYITAVRTGNTIKMFQNGAEVASSATAGTIYSGAWTAAIGRDPFANDSYFDGKIAEVILSNVARSDDYIKYRQGHYRASQYQFSSEDCGGTPLPTNTNTPTWTPTNTPVSALCTPGTEEEFYGFCSSASEKRCLDDLDCTGSGTCTKKCVSPYGWGLRDANQGFKDAGLLDTSTGSLANSIRAMAVDNNGPISRFAYLDGVGNRIILRDSIGTCQLDSNKKCSNDVECTGFGTCVLTPNLAASFVLPGNKADLTERACNGDNNTGRFRTTNDTSLCFTGFPTGDNVAEQWTHTGMAFLDSDLYVIDYWNNRIPKFNDPWGTDGVMDDVYCQPDFASNLANQGGSPTKYTCDFNSWWSSHTYGNISFGPNGEMVIVDTGNHRVKILPDPTDKDTVICIGQADCNSNSAAACGPRTIGSSEPTTLCGPKAAFIHPVSGKLYVSNEGAYGSGDNADRITVYAAGFTTGSAPEDHIYIDSIFWRSLDSNKPYFQEWKNPTWTQAGCVESTGYCMPVTDAYVYGEYVSSCEQGADGNGYCIPQSCSSDSVCQSGSCNLTTGKCNAGSTDNTMCSTDGQCQSGNCDKSCKYLSTITGLTPDPNNSTIWVSEEYPAKRVINIDLADITDNGNFSSVPADKAIGVSDLYSLGESYIERRNQATCWKTAEDTLDLWDWVYWPIGNVGFDRDNNIYIPYFGQGKIISWDMDTWAQSYVFDPALPQYPPINCPVKARTNSYQLWKTTGNTGITNARVSGETIGMTKVINPDGSDKIVLVDNSRLMQYDIPIGDGASAELVANRSGSFVPSGDSHLNQIKSNALLMSNEQHQLMTVQLPLTANPTVIKNNIELVYEFDPTAGYCSGDTSEPCSATNACESFGSCIPGLPYGTYVTATNPANGKVYVGDGGRVMRLSDKEELVSTVPGLQVGVDQFIGTTNWAERRCNRGAGVANAGINTICHVTDMTFDAGGNLYVVDSARECRGDHNYRISIFTKASLDAAEGNPFPDLDIDKVVNSALSQEMTNKSCEGTYNGTAYDNRPFLPVDIRCHPTIPGRCIVSHAGTQGADPSSDQRQRPWYSEFYYNNILADVKPYDLVHLPAGASGGQFYDTSAYYLFDRQWQRLWAISDLAAGWIVPNADAPWEGTPTPSANPSVTPTGAPGATSTPTSVFTATNTAQPTPTFTNTPTFVPTLTPTQTAITTLPPTAPPRGYQIVIEDAPTPADTHTTTKSPTRTLTPTRTRTFTNTPIPSLTFTPTRTFTRTGTGTRTPTPGSTATRTKTNTPSGNRVRVEWTGLRKPAIIFSNLSPRRDP